jgi:hypothetical protein
VKRPVADCPLTVVDGALVRLFTDSDVIWVEQWTGQSWVAGGAMIDEVMKGQTASPETLRKFGYPVTELLECQGRK